MEALFSNGVARGGGGGQQLPCPFLDTPLPIEPIQHVTYCLLQQSNNYIWIYKPMLLLFVFINITFPLNYLLATGIELYVITMF